MSRKVQAFSHARLLIYKTLAIAVTTGRILLALRASKKMEELKAG
jgi:hypothetical protein